MPAVGEVVRFSDILELRKPEQNASTTSEIPSVVQSTLVVFFSWLGAPKLAIDKYCSLYQSRGFHVLVVAGKALQFAWPHNSLRLAHLLMSMLSTQLHQFPHLLVHGVSIGCFNYAGCLALACRFPSRYGNFLGRLKGVILDSMTQGSMERMVKGMILGLRLSGTQQWIFGKLLDLYFWATHVETVEYFNRALRFFRESPAQVPTLVLASIDDPLSDPESLASMLKMWREQGRFALIEMVWEHSAHSAHLRLHKEEYIQKLEEFLSVFSKFAAQDKPVQSLKAKV